MGRGENRDFMASRTMALTGSTPVRIPADVCLQVRAIGSVTRRTPGSLLAEAWKEYFEAHREELERDFDTMRHLIREGDTDGLVAFMQKGSRAEAESMMRDAGLTD